MIQIPITINGHNYDQILIKARKNGFNVDALAKDLGISRKSLYNYSITHTGVKPKQWLGQTRAVWFRDLICSKYTIQESADYLQYRSMSHLIKDCKYWHQCTPKQLQQRWCTDYKGWDVWMGGRKEYIKKLVEQDANLNKEDLENECPKS